MKNRIKKSLSCIGAIVLLITSLILPVIANKNNDNTKFSPLFSVRSRNQIDRYNYVNIERDFLGKAKSKNFISVKKHFAISNINDLMIEIIQLDKSEYNKYVQIILSDLIEKNDITNKDVEVLRGFFNYLKTKPKDTLNLLISDTTGKSEEFLTHGCPSLSWCPTFEQTPIRCFIFLITFPLWLIYYCLTTMLRLLNQNICICTK